MISEYTMALRLADGFKYLPDVAKDLLIQGRIQEAITVLIQNGYAHLEPSRSEAERGFNDAGYCSVPHRAIAS